MYIISSEFNYSVTNWNIKIHTSRYLPHRQVIRPSAHVTENVYVLKISLLSKTSHENVTFGFAAFCKDRYDMKPNQRNCIFDLTHSSQLFRKSAITYLYLYWQWRNSPCGARSPYSRGLIITLRHTTQGRTHLDEWSARRRELYLIKTNIHKRQTCTPPAGIEPTNPASQRPQTHAFDHFHVL
jgi:hypothetical protein